MLLIGQEKNTNRDNPQQNQGKPEKMGKSQKKDKKGQTGSDREAPLFETPSFSGSGGEGGNLRKPGVSDFHFKGPKIEKFQDRPPGLKFSSAIEFFKRRPPNSYFVCGGNSQGQD